MSGVRWDSARQQWQENVQQRRLACCRPNSPVLLQVICDVQKWPTHHTPEWSEPFSRLSRRDLDQACSRKTALLPSYFTIHHVEYVTQSCRQRKKNKLPISQRYGATDVHWRLLRRKENDSWEPLKVLECLEKFKKFNQGQTLLNLRYWCRVCCDVCSLAP